MSYRIEITKADKKKLFSVTGIHPLTKLLIFFDTDTKILVDDNYPKTWSIISKDEKFAYRFIHGEYDSVICSKDCTTWHRIKNTVKHFKINWTKLINHEEQVRLVVKHTKGSILYW